jgi:glycosyltransferase involved in cell wall biosynthesis
MSQTPVESLPPSGAAPRTLALIPAHNEAPRIAAVVTAARAHLPVLVVDDGSTDQTAARAEEAGAQVLRQVPNQGKGAALRAGFRRALDEGYDGALTLDGDGQHDPGEIPAFLAMCRQSSYDLVVGARSFRHMPLIRRISNTLGRWSFSWALGQPVRDNQSGYRWISRRLMTALLDSSEAGFEFEVEMLVVCVRSGWVLGWVPIRTIYGDQESHIRPLHHVVQFCRMVWKTRREVNKPGREVTRKAV